MAIASYKIVCANALQRLNLIELVLEREVDLSSLTVRDGLLQICLT